MDNKDFKYKDITEKIIGCAMKVHRTLGNGFQEVIYQRALEIEMFSSRIIFEREKDMDIYYEGYKIGTRRVDFLIENKISLELKALAILENVHLAQAKNYLETYNVETGLLINFGAKSLEMKRIFNNSYDPNKEIKINNPAILNPVNPNNPFNPGSRQLGN